MAVLGGGVRVPGPRKASERGCSPIQKEDQESVIERGEGERKGKKPQVQTY